jgi:hypothetical protein
MFYNFACFYTKLVNVYEYFSGKNYTSTSAFDVSRNF